MACEFYGFGNQDCRASGTWVEIKDSNFAESVCKGNPMACPTFAAITAAKQAGK